LLKSYLSDCSNVNFIIFESRNLPKATSTKHQILKTTLRLFQERGLAKVSTRDVAEAAGLSRSHLYYYFQDWETLRKAVFEYFVETQLEAMYQLVEGLTPVQALKAFLEDCLPTEEDTVWTLWLNAWDEAMGNTEFTEIYITKMRAWESILKDAIAQGCMTGEFKCKDPARVARQLFALVNGYADDLLLRPSHTAAKGALEEVLEVASVLLGKEL
jgi:AcrR family transcriptional regulator